MKTTTNFGFKTYDGTDLFNPLTVENENMVKLDSELNSIYKDSVGSATHLKSGATNALTMVTKGVKMFTFTATADYSFGDNFTIDGGAVNATTVNGTALPDRAFITGSVVLASITGTKLTVYGATPSTVEDSKKLNGHPAEYFGTADDVETNSTNIRNAVQRLNTIESAVNSATSFAVGEVAKVRGNFEGHLTGSNKNLLFTIPLYKKIPANCSKVTLRGLLTARCDGAYLLNSQAVTLELTDLYTDNYLPMLTFNYTSTVSLGGTNNSAVDVFISANGTLAFE